MSKNTRYLGLDVHAETITRRSPRDGRKSEVLGNFPIGLKR